MFGKALLLVRDAVMESKGAKSKKLKEVVLLMPKKNLLGFNDIAATVLDNVSKLLGHVVSPQLVSSTDPDGELFSFPSP
ncbi:hypothetical protein Tsubulata_019842 [Turnera subulata]|uniref:Uncharacterized protein n=1 Tax=Turnera subulata TaxID=218843 RepID=A0A9Q0EY76_9ROSI|nr:hypothetical protein Tsubulata_019842 [Turnera subulata]